MLKGIMTPEDVSGNLRIYIKRSLNVFSPQPPEEFVKNYLVLIPCQSFSDFQKMLDLKVRSSSCGIY